MRAAGTVCSVLLLVAPIKQKYVICGKVGVGHQLMLHLRELQVLRRIELQRETGGCGKINDAAGGEAARQRTRARCK